MRGKSICYDINSLIFRKRTLNLEEFGNKNLEIKEN